MHFHYGLFADILSDLASTVASMAPDDATHRDALRTAAKALYQALEPKDHVGEREAARSKFKDKESPHAFKRITLNLARSKDFPSGSARTVVECDGRARRSLL